MKNHDDIEILSRYDEYVQIFEDWINRTISEDQTRLNKLYSDLN
jgi:hypothetical protein